MARIYHRLTLRHLSRGWSIYWRLSVPFWIHLTYALSAFSLAFLVESQTLCFWARKLTPKVLDHPYGLTVLGSGLIYGAGFPVLRLLVRWIAQKSDTRFYRSQFEILRSLDHLNRGLITLLVALLFFFATQWERFDIQLTVFWIWFFFMSLVLIGTISLFVALYGWLSDQFDDIQEKTPSP